MDAWEQMKQDFVDAVVPLVIESIRREMTEIGKDNFNFFFTEEEAAEKLKLSPQTLKRERDAGAIDYVTYRGKIAYMPHHLLGYAQRNEVRNGKQEITLKDILGKNSENVVRFPKAAA